MTPLVLRQPTAVTWLDACIADLPALLSDHAHCERKAAASALSLVSRAPGDSVLVRAMAALAREEAGHLQRVHDALLARGWVLRDDARDDYVLALRGRVARGRVEQLVDELLVCALIELRSAERLGILAHGLPDPDLRTLYTDLAGSEQGHAMMFVERARGQGDPAGVDARLSQWLDYEADVVRGLAVRARVHG